MSIFFKNYLFKLLKNLLTFDQLLDYKKVLKMKNILLFFIFMLLPITVFSQTKEKAQDALVKELNTILRSSDQHHWAYEGKMTVDSDFAIDKNGILSMTVNYKTDSTNVKVRMEAPINKAKSVLYDAFLILEFGHDEVKVFEIVNETGKEEEKHEFRNYLFHFGLPLEHGYEKQQKLENLLQKVLKFTSCLET